MESITLDPTELIPERVPLGLHELGLEVREEGADWGESAVEVATVRQAIGELPSDRHLPNVEMTLPLRVRAEGETSLAEALQPLQQKVGLWQAEGGGWIGRAFDVGGFAGTVAYRTHAASLAGVQGWGMAHRLVVPGVVLTVTRSPICYALVEVESEEFTEESARELIFELAEIAGTHPGLIRIRITNEGEEDLRGLILAGESRDHPQDETADTTAALAYDAADLTLKGGSEVKEAEGEQVVEHDELTAGWLSILGSEITAEELSHMTHRGVRRLWIRGEDPGSEAGDVQLRLRWRALGSLRWFENAVVPTPLVDNYQLLDMGQCRPEQAAIGDERWEWELQARAVSGSGKVRIHKVYPLPAEQYVVVSAPDTSQGADAQSTKSPGAGSSGIGEGAISWSNSGNALTADGSAATVKFKEGQEESHDLLLDDFAHGLPEESTVVGVLAAVKCSASTDGAIKAIVSLIREGSKTLLKRVDQDYWGTDSEYRFYGASDDLWGEDSLPLSGAEWNDPDSGVAIKVMKHSALKGEVEASVDHVYVVVYYTGAADQNRVCFAGRSLEIRSDGIYRQHPTEDIWGRLIPEHGFYPKAAPSGLEGRASRYIVIPGQGDLEELADSGTNPLSAQVHVRGGFHFSREAV